MKRLLFFSAVLVTLLASGVGVAHGALEAPTLTYSQSVQGVTTWKWTLDEPQNKNEPENMRTFLRFMTEPELIRGIFRYSTASWNAGGEEPRCAEVRAVKLGSPNEESAWSSEVCTPGFVTACETKFCLEGATFRFDGFNMFYVNSRNNDLQSCGETVSTSELEGAFEKQVGAEAVRAWFFQPTATAEGKRNWIAFDNTLSVAAAHHLKVIVALQNQWSNCVRSEFGYKTQAWYEKGYKEKQGTALTSYREYVKEVVERYKNNPTILTWQLVNESEAKTASSGSCEEANAEKAALFFYAEAFA